MFPGQDSSSHQSTHSMKIKAAVISSAFIALLSTASADTFTLKDGSTLEATILREQGEAYVLQVQVTKSIKDERVVPKADVVKIERAKLDLVAFESIATLAAIPDMLTKEEYEERIARVVKFTKDHLNSEKYAEARTILASHKKELAQIEAGGIKVNGKLISPAEYRANALDIDASVAERRIRSLLKEEKQIDALRAFSSFDSEFRNTAQFQKLLPLMVQYMRQYVANAEQQLASYDKRTKERQSGLSVMQMEDRRKTETAIREETAAFEARLKREKDAKIGWVSTHSYFKPSLDEAVKFGKQEINRLSKLPILPPPDAGKAYRDALQAISTSADKAEIATALSTAKTAMVSQKYLATLDAAAASPSD